MSKVFVFISIIFSFNLLNAQEPEFGVFAGGSYYIGDINPYKHFTQQDIVIGGIYRYNFKNERIVLRINLLYGRVHAADTKSGLQLQVNRNFSFRSDIFEIGPVFEINFFPYILGQSKTDKAKFGTPYFFGGITYMRMNPQAKYEGGWIDLQPLGTEGQGTSLNSKKRYSLNQISIPFGIGLKMNISSRLALSLEYGMRKTFTDYLDDVSGLYPDQSLLADQSGIVAASLSDRSDNPEGINNSNYGLQRGNPNDRDWYSFSGIIISFKLFRKSTCPTF